MSNIYERTFYVAVVNLNETTQATVVKAATELRFICNLLQSMPLGTIKRKVAHFSISSVRRAPSARLFFIPPAWTGALNKRIFLIVSVQIVLIFARYTSGSFVALLMIQLFYEVN